MPVLLSRRRFLWHTILLHQWRRRSFPTVHRYPGSCISCSDQTMLPGQELQGFWCLLHFSAATWGDLSKLMGHACGRDTLCFRKLRLSTNELGFVLGRQYSQPDGIIQKNVTIGLSLPTIGAMVDKHGNHGYQGKFVIRAVEYV